MKLHIDFLSLFSNKQKRKKRIPPISIINIANKKNDHIAVRRYSRITSFIIYEVQLTLISKDCLRNSLKSIKISINFCQPVFHCIECTRTVLIHFLGSRSAHCTQWSHLINHYQFLFTVLLNIIPHKAGKRAGRAHYTYFLRHGEASIIEL